MYLIYENGAGLYGDMVLLCVLVFELLRSVCWSRVLSACTCIQEMTSCTSATTLTVSTEIHFCRRHLKIRVDKAQ